MLSNNQKKLIRSLSQKKQRDQQGLFLAEGEKIVGELLSSGEGNVRNIVLLAGSASWKHSLEEIPGATELLFHETSEDEMKKLSTLVTPPQVMAVVRKPSYDFEISALKTDLTIMLDSLRDPGNLGTIIRTADWFGIRDIICTPDSVDCFNSKVVQASMGAIFRVRVHYHDPVELLELAGRHKIPVYGTTMDGHILQDTPVRQPGMIVFGNESTGIRKELLPYFRDRIRIPDFPQGKSGTESLNVASSVAIMCAEIRRRSPIQSES
jgi:TrmH family RNA methyltransferase